MPTRNLQNSPELYVAQPDGTKVILGKILEPQIFDDVSPDIQEESMFTFQERTATFEVRWNPSIDMVYLLIHGRLPSNNWRKMHGLPMKRKIRKNSRNERKTI